MRLFKSRKRFSTTGRVVVLKKDWAKEARSLVRRLSYFLVPVIIFAILSYQSGFARASSTLYHPSSCLGDWEGVFHALGSPDLPFGTDKFSLHEHNSAKFSGGKAKLFCGNFSGEDLRGANFQKALLTLHWGLIYEREYAGQLPVPTPESDSSEDSLKTTSTEEEIPSTPSSVEFQEESLPKEEIEKSSSTSFWWGSIAYAEEPPIEIATFSPEEQSSNGISSTVSDEKIPHSENQQLTEDTSNATSHHLTPLTLTELSERLANSSSIPISGEAQDENSKTLEIPFDIANPEADKAKEDAIPISLDSNVIVVSYSLDGENWKDLALMYARDWHLAQYEIPVRNWDEVQDLQVRLAVNSDEQDPFVIFLDGMSLTVEYSPAPPEWFMRFLPKTVPQKEIQIEPKRTVYAPEARHECEITPFKEETTGGKESEFIVHLRPADPVKIYTLSLGELPTGVSGKLANSETTSTIAGLKISTDKNAQKGSFNITVIYEERQENGQAIPNFCQLNLDIL